MDSLYLRPPDAPKWNCGSHLTIGGVRMNITTLGVDLAKTSFSLAGMDKHGKIVLRKTLTRARLLAFIAQLPPCLIGN